MVLYTICDELEGRYLIEHGEKLVFTRGFDEVFSADCTPEQLEEMFEKHRNKNEKYEIYHITEDEKDEC